MAAEAGGAERCGIGTRLRTGRERLGMTVLQAAEKLHVDPKVLESLEAEDFESLGAPVFVRGHLRRYAELIGERASELQDLYAASTRVEAPDLTRLPKVAPSRDPRKLVVPAVVILVGFALAGSVWWVLRGIDATIDSALPDPIAPTAQVLQPAAREGEAPQVPPSSTSSQPPDTSQPSAVTPPPAAAPAPKAAPPAAPADARPEPQTVAQKPAEPPRPRTTELILRFSADSWVEVYDANGERLFFDIGSADTVKTLTGTPPLRVVLGNAPGVALEVNGRAASVPPEMLQKNDSAQFVINRSGRIVRATASGG